MLKTTKVKEMFVKYIKYDVKFIKFYNLIL